MHFLLVSRPEIEYTATSGHGTGDESCDITRGCTHG